MTTDTRDDRLRHLDAQDVKAPTDPALRVDRDLDDDDDVADGGDLSPHLGGRAQPGDVLGLETGGETTELGDTAEDENERRRDSTEK
jgi:hypothetical protein